MYMIEGDLGGSVFTIGALTGELPPSCSGDPSACRATEIAFDRTKGAFEKAGWPQPLSQAFVAADSAWQALKSRPATISASEYRDTQRTFSDLAARLKKVKTAGKSTKPATSADGGVPETTPVTEAAPTGILAGVPRWAWYAAGGAAALGIGGLYLSRRRKAVPQATAKT